MSTKIRAIHGIKTKVPQNEKTITTMWSTNLLALKSVALIITAVKKASQN